MSAMLWKNVTSFPPLVQTVVSLRGLRFKQTTGPWITSENVENICDQDFYIIRSKHFVLDFFCKDNNKLQRDINKTKDDYISCKKEENKKNPLKAASNISPLTKRTLKYRSS